MVLSIKVFKALYGSLWLTFKLLIFWTKSQNIPHYCNIPIKDPKIQKKASLNTAIYYLAVHSKVGFGKKWSLVGNNTTVNSWMEVILYRFVLFSCNLELVQVFSGCKEARCWVI